MVSHRSLLNTLRHRQRCIPLQSDDCVLQTTPSSFDPSVWEFFGPLLAGASLSMSLPQVQQGGIELVPLIRREGITTLALGPAWLEAFLAEAELEHCTSLRRVFCGGEVLPLGLQRRCHERLRATLYNLYGPTEAAINATWWQCQPTDQRQSVPIGRPIDNTQVYLLDRSLQPVAVGVVGEIYLGGLGLAQGYLGRPELTAERFIPNPFAGRPGTRLYRTGDLARYLDDGALEYLGRIDTQVKIRGHRIEIGEVEHVLGAHPALQEVAVVAREDPASAGARLVAYATPRPGQTPRLSDLRQHLQQRLPDFMLPAAMVILDQFPRTANGKIDRRALPAPDELPLDDQSAAVPRDVFELRLSLIWEELLHRGPIGVTASFFEHGGHSLLAVKMQHRIQQRFGLIVPLATIFQSPTIAQLARILRQEAGVLGEAWSVLEAIHPEGSLPPLYCVAPFGGMITAYIRLARYLGPDQPVYGLQPPGLDGAQEPHRRIEDLAAAYLATLRQHQPDGPYFLCGWSMGGLIAYEMARQLAAQGAQVGLVALLDTRTPVRTLESGVIQIVRELGFAANDLPLDLPIDDLIPFMFEQAASMELMPAMGDLKVFRQYIYFLLAQVAAIQSYRVGSYPGPVLLLRATDGPRAAEDSADFGWKDWVTGALTIDDILSTHDAMIADPAVQAVADRLRQALAFAQSPKLED